MKLAKLETLYVEKQRADSELELWLERNKEFLSQYKKMQETAQKADEALRKAAIKALDESGTDLIDTGLIRANRYAVRSYVVEDESKLPTKFKNLQKYEQSIKKMKADIKESFELLNKPIPGIRQNKKMQVRIPIRDNKESA